DNGRSLFYEDTEEMVRKAVRDPVKYATSFGYSGTYWDYILDIAAERGGLHGLIDPDVTESEIGAILSESGFTGYRYNGALEWIQKAIDMIRSC
ncbi:MAG: hypothetical protein FWG48_03105, partial [Oscillospiraceae bacterium]|nr:hypothetical protein [Oscillospiraceae bacterium]